MISYTVTNALTPISVRAFLKQKGVSGAMFRRIKHHGGFWRNGVPVLGEKTILMEGDTIAYSLPPHEQRILPERIPLDIRYEDEGLLVVNKPAGMLVHPAPSVYCGTLANAILGYYRDKGLPYGFHSVHRLDRMTSGLVLVAKRPELQHLLSTKEGQLFHREYIAIAEGILSPEAGTIDAPIARDPASIITRIASTEGKRAVTHYRTLRTFPDASHPCSLLRLSLVTGRTHQIRVHLSHIGHPLLGDDLYGGDTSRISRQALHAEHLFFSHPLTGEEIDIHAEPPSDFRALLIPS